jgi:hypothetical protein
MIPTILGPHTLAKHLKKTFCSSPTLRREPASSPLISLFLEQATTAMKTLYWSLWRVGADKKIYRMRIPNTVHLLLKNLSRSTAERSVLLGGGLQELRLLYPLLLQLVMGSPFTAFVYWSLCFYYHRLPSVLLVSLSKVTMNKIRSFWTALPCEIRYRTPATEPRSFTATWV